MNRATNLVHLNHEFLKVRIKELDLKLWWIAEQIKVDRKTLSRWVNGRVKWAQRVNAKSLAGILECPMEHMIHLDEIEEFASSKELGEAAKLMEQEKLFELVSAKDKFPLLESLIKATIQSHLPQSLLGTLYNYLSVSKWQQSMCEDALYFAEKALKIGEAIGDPIVMSKAFMNKGIVLAKLDRLEEALQVHEDNFYGYCHNIPMAQATAMGNIGSVFWRLERYTEAADAHVKSLSFYQKVEGEKPFVAMAISAQVLFLIYMAEKNFAKAKEYLDKFEEFSQLGEYTRGRKLFNLSRSEYYWAIQDLSKFETFFSAYTDDMLNLSKEDYALRTGRLYIAKNEVTEGLSILKQALESHKDSYERERLETEIQRAQLLIDS